MFTNKIKLGAASVLVAGLSPLMMVGAVGAIEIDKWLQGGVMALLGATMFMLALYSQELYKEAK